jgi:ribonuclease P protein component
MGSWTAFVAPGGNPRGRLIVALGRSAGGSVTRSRVRRLARDVFASLHDEVCGLDLLLLARDDVREQPRRQIRIVLHRLMTRVADAVGRRRASQDDAGG